MQYKDFMPAARREQVFRLDDFTDQAISARLKAARLVAGYAKQTDFAAALGIPYKTYHAQEKKGHPAVSTVRFLHKNHRIDFNFVYNGEFAQLPVDVRDALEAALSDETP